MNHTDQPDAPQHTFRRRAATRLLGEARARRVGGVKSVAQASAYRTLTSEGREMRRRIETYKDRHVGERCVIIGNGPSLNKTDLHLLQSETTFGLNRIYLMYDRLGFSTTYNAVVNKHVIEQCSSDLRALSAPLFTSRAAGEALRRPGADTLELSDLVGPRFSTDLSLGIWQGATVTYVAMQVAYYMGFHQVVLVGVDHSFVDKGPAHRLVESQGADPNHFDPNYFGKGFRWQLPDLETSEIAYALAKRQFESEGRSIVDATVGGKLQVFPKGELETLLSA